MSWNSKKEIDKMKVAYSAKNLSVCLVSCTTVPVLLATPK